MLKNINLFGGKIYFTSLTVLLSLFFLQQETIAQVPFAKGADVSWLSEMEYNLYKFKDNNGVQKDCLEILKEKGINSLRFRVWVDPANGFCGKKDVVRMAQRADSLGFNVMLDFHYSDSWADPGKQNKPAAWANDSLSKLLNDIYNHTYSVLDTLKSVGVVPKWVQIGNEVNDGFLWEEGRASTHMSNFAEMLKSGYDAVKTVDSTIKVVIHLANGQDDAVFRWMFDSLKNDGVKWDVIGMSVYPYQANSSWQEDDSLALITMKDMISRYNTKVMVCEAGYFYNQPVEANHYLLDLIAKTKSVGGLGVFYWEPECYNWQNYKLGAWDPSTKEPTAAMDAFLGIDVTSVNRNENTAPENLNLNIYPNPFNPGTTIEYMLPESSNASIIIFNLLGEEVAKLVEGFEEKGSYKITWLANGIPSGVYICRITSGGYSFSKKIILLK